jgi:proteasome lid subunit RPN8/RPN11
MTAVSDVVANASTRAVVVIEPTALAACVTAKRAATPFVRSASLKTILARPASRFRRKRPTLRFTPTAWAKLRFLRDLGPTEVGGFGISHDDLLFIDDIRLVKQRCGPLSVVFDDAAIADFFDEMTDAGLSPENFARIWIHTHPGNSPQPSLMDLRTFASCFGRCDWSVMMILAEDDSTFARLQFRAGPGGSIDLKTRVTYDQPFDGSDHDAWRAEYEESVEILPPPPLRTIVIDDDFQSYRSLDFEAIDQGEVEPEPWYSQEGPWPTH